MLRIFYNLLRLLLNLIRINILHKNYLKWYTNQELEVGPGSGQYLLVDYHKGMHEIL